MHYVKKMPLFATEKPGSAVVLPGSQNTRRTLITQSREGQEGLKQGTRRPEDGRAQMQTKEFER